jgi:hypothetical protein
MARALVGELVEQVLGTVAVEWAGTEGAHAIP